MSKASSPKAFLDKACAYLTDSTDPFHAVHHAVQRLQAAGFTRWSAKPHTTLQNGGKYYYTVQNSTLVAFAVGGKAAASANTLPGFLVVGAHTDSPNLRVKPHSSKGPNNAGSGVTQLNVECYGGGLWHTWFDRDLSLSGRVMVRENGQQLRPRLVQCGREPLARVSTLAIHLQSAEERKAFAVNKEDHTSPIIGMRDTALEKAVLEQISGGEEPKDEPSDSFDPYAWHRGQEPALLHRIAQELDVSVKDIADFELCLYDTQPAALGGLQKEFLYSARLDNLASVFCAVEALVDTSSDTARLDASSDIHLIACFDHEEVGSTSATGAGSPILQEAMQSITESLLGNNSSTTLSNAIAARSFCLSVDQAHAVHPNYASKHQAQHRPTLNRGMVIKSNANQRYATTGTALYVRELSRRHCIPVQEFCVRNDCPCGSTIGPRIASLTGMRTVDIGMPQLSMHSCREVMGVRDLEYGYAMLRAFFREFRGIDEQVVKEIGM